MRLLIATDHRYLRSEGGVFDTYCFDSQFFTDYLQVFEEVTVLCRMAEQRVLPGNAFPTGGPGITFAGVPDARGAAWILRSRALASGVLDSVLAKSDAVVVRAPSELGWHAAQAAMRAGKPYMAEVIGDPREALVNAGNGLLFRVAAGRTARRLRRLLRQAAAASYVSRTVLPQAYPVASGVPTDIISSIRLAPSALTEPRRFDCVPTPLRMVTVASLLPYKRHRDIVRAVRHVTDQGVAVEAHFAGDGPARRELEQMSAQLGVSARVVFHGHIADRAALMQLLDDSDLFVLASATEGLPRAMVEAMARGLPVIGSRAGGIVDLVRPADSFPVGDVAALTGVLKAVASGPARLREMSRHSIETAKQYTSDVLSPKRIRLYRLLRERASARLNAGLRA